jgi:hypothetical protein
VIAAQYKSAWAVKWESRNRLDGYRCDLVSHPGELPPAVLFETRREAREYIATSLAYIRSRRDLRAEPHGWLAPKAVRVTVSVVEQTR